MFNLLADKVIVGDVELTEDLLELIPNSQERQRCRSRLPHVIVATSRAGAQSLASSLETLEDYVWLLSRREYHHYKLLNQENPE